MWEWVAGTDPGFGPLGACFSPGPCCGLLTCYAMPQRSADWGIAFIGRGSFHDPAEQILACARHLRGPAPATRPSIEPPGGETTRSRLIWGLASRLAPLIREIPMKLSRVSLPGIVVFGMAVALWPAGRPEIRA